MTYACYCSVCGMRTSPSPNLCACQPAPAERITEIIVERDRLREELKEARAQSTEDHAAMLAALGESMRLRDALGASEALLADCRDSLTSAREKLTLAAGDRKLIADLLEKAQAVIAWWDAFFQTTQHDIQPECENAEFNEFAQLRAAIAKAKQP